MTRPIYLTYTPAPTDADALANDVAENTFTLTANSAGDNLAHLITITNNSSTDYTGINITVTGTDSYGKVQTETITGPDDSLTVTTTKYFLTVSTVVPSEALGEGDTFDIGIDEEAVSQIIPINYQNYSWPLTNQVAVTGTVSYTIQQSASLPYRDINDPSYSPGQDMTWFDDTNATNKSANLLSTIAFPIQAQRMKINSVSSGATVSFTILHSNVS